MAIAVTCESCGKTLRAKDSAAGKHTRCPDCGQSIEIPFPQETADDCYEYDKGGYDDEPEEYGWGSASTSRDSGGDTRSCPVCAETIKAVAVKCRYCGEVFDSTLRRRQGKSSSRGRALATPGSRLAAVLLDGLIQIPAVAAVFAGISLADGGNEELGFVLLGLGILIVCVIAIYQLVIISRDGQSIGKRMMKIRIVKYDDNSNPGFVHAVLLRAFVSGLIGSIPLVGHLYSLADPLFIFSEEHRCLHDRIANTKVVEAG